MAQTRLRRPHLLRQLLHLPGGVAAVLRPNVTPLFVPCPYHLGGNTGLVLPAAAALGHADPDHGHLAVLPEPVPAGSGLRLVSGAAWCFEMALPGGAEIAERPAHARLGAVVGRVGVGVRLAQDRSNQWEQLSNEGALRVRAGDRQRTPARHTAGLQIHEDVKHSPSWAQAQHAGLSRHRQPPYQVALTEHNWTEHDRRRRVAPAKPGALRAAPA